MVAKVTNKKAKIKYEYEKRFPKDLWEIVEDEKDIVIVPKDPRILQEAERLVYGRKGQGEDESLMAKGFHHYWPPGWHDFWGFG